MANNLANRIDALERSAARRAPALAEAVSFLIMPKEGDPARDGVQAQIDARDHAGLKTIIFKVV